MTMTEMFTFFASKLEFWFPMGTNWDMQIKPFIPQELLQIFCSFSSCQSFQFKTDCENEKTLAQRKNLMTC